MNYYDRKQHILEILTVSGGISNINTLCKKIFSSPSTIRRDLITLEEEGIIRRHHGYVSVVAKSATESPIGMRRIENQDKKMAMAEAAKNLFHDNMVIFLDSSSTVSYLAAGLKSRKNITVITNGINVASQLMNAQNIRCYLCPGVLKPNSLSIIGEYASAFLENFHAEAVFFSCKAINARGIFEGNDAQGLVKRKMLENADRGILLCDNTKELSSGFFKLCPLKQVHTLVSNAPFSEELEESLQANMKELIYAKKAEKQ